MSRRSFSGRNVNRRGTEIEPTWKLVHMLPYQKLSNRRVHACWIVMFTLEIIIAVFPSNCQSYDCVKSLKTPLVGIFYLILFLSLTCCRWDSCSHHDSEWRPTVVQTPGWSIWSWCSRTRKRTILSAGGLQGQNKTRNKLWWWVVKSLTFFPLLLCYCLGFTRVSGWNEVCIDLKNNKH